MAADIILASGSEIRAALLRQAGVAFRIAPVALDEDAIRDAMIADGAQPRDIADALAEGKAQKAAGKHPGALVIGSDQILDHDGHILSKAGSREEAKDQLMRLRGSKHKLYSAAVAFEDGRPVWRHIGQANLTMRNFSDAYLDEYLDRNWPDVGSSVGCYRIEEEGIRLFTRVDGSWHAILGLPLLELLAYLSLRGIIQT